jgi:hypothetical protein
VNFVSVLKVCFSSGFSVNSMLGGENQRSNINRFTGCSEKAQPSYLEPNSGSLQKPIGGLSENDRGGVAIDAENRQNHVKTGEGKGLPAELSELYPEHSDPQRTTPHTNKESYQ